MPPAGAPKRSHPGVEARSPVAACSMRLSIAVAIPTQTVIARALSRDTNCIVRHGRFQKSRMPRHKHFERRPRQRQPMRMLNKLGGRAPTPQIVQRMRDKSLTPHFLAAESVCTYVIRSTIANLQKMAVAERREAEPTTGRRNELGLAVRQATIEILADICRQKSCKPITVSCRSHAGPLQPTMRFPEILGPLAWA